MNKIRISRMLFAGLVTFVVWVLVELVIEGVIGNALFGRCLARELLQMTTIRHWGIPNQVLNIAIALLNCTILAWLYAALRPMYGVGTKTALITSAFGIVFTVSVTINAINMGLVPAKVGLIECLYEAIEFPIAMIAGAMAYEGISESLAGSEA